MSYFTSLDVLGSLFAFILFFIVFLIPGYIVGTSLDLFGFKNRQELSKYVFSIVISASTVPIIIYLLSLVLTLTLAKYVFIFSLMWFFYIKIDGRRKNLGKNKFIFHLSRYQKGALLVVLGWLLLTIFMMVDVQWGERLYFNVISLDSATRVALVDAITRTGVPPVNPSYFPGHPTYINSLYYFWYILCSAIDQFGGRIVDARVALIAGNAWAGIILASATAVYLKLRNDLTGDEAWKFPLIGIGLFSISGLDFIPALLYMVVTRLSLGVSIPFGDVEQWNAQITAWVGSLLWVPHHVMAMVACIFTLTLLHFGRVKSGLNRMFALYIVGGLSLASAIGLSTWVAVVFVVFLGLACLFLLIRKIDKEIYFSILAMGVFALIFASPFLAGILQGGTGAEGYPIIIEVRRLLPVSFYISKLPGVIENLLFLFLLPVNYFMELGFFFLVGIVWFQMYSVLTMRHRSIEIFEVILLLAVFVVCSFVRSSIVPSNEIGWRGWLLGQFILLVWAVDLLKITPVFKENFGYIKNKVDMLRISPQRILIFFAVAGLLTSLVDLALLRLWPIFIDLNIAGFPNQISPDTQLGKRTYASRLAYEFIRDNLPEGVVIQQNPLNGVDRPSGLYGTRQFAISSNAPYNVPLTVLNENKNQISKIFTSEKMLTWKTIDSICENYYIDVIVVDDVDPLWDQLAELNLQRMPIYSNNYYSVYWCGEFPDFNP